MQRFNTVRLNFCEGRFALVPVEAIDALSMTDIGVGKVLINGYLEDMNMLYSGAITLDRAEIECNWSNVGTTVLDLLLENVGILSVDFLSEGTTLTYFVYWDDNPDQCDANIHQTVHTFSACKETDDKDLVVIKFCRERG